MSRITVLSSRPSRRLLSTPYGATDDDTAYIARAVTIGLKALGHEVTELIISEDTITSVAKIKAECVFNLIEWCGLDIHLSEQAFRYLRGLNIPVTGSSEKLFVLTGDKIALKKKLKELGFTVPAAAFFETGSEPVPTDLPYPVIVKPSLEHCSMGLDYRAIAENETELLPIVRRQLAEFEQPVFAEEFIKGRELEVYLLEEEGKVKMLPVEEIIFSGDREYSFQTYASKWIENDPDYQSTEVDLAKLTGVEKARIEDISIRAFMKLGLWGYSRFDIRVRDGVPYILETNANPSVYDDVEELKDVNKEVIYGIKFVDYIDTIVKAAYYHYRRGDRV